MRPQALVGFGIAVMLAAIAAMLTPSTLKIIIFGLGGLMAFYGGWSLVRGPSRIEDQAAARRWTELSRSLHTALQIHRAQPDPMMNSAADWNIRTAASMAYSTRFGSDIEANHGAALEHARHEMKAKGFETDWAFGWSTNPLSVQAAADSIGAAGLALAQKVRLQQGNT
jgi:hypothetical protein